MEVLEGKLTNKEVAEKLREQADVLQKYIDGKLNSAISRQRPTARRMRIYNGMREDALAMENLQTILRALASAHESNRILQFPHLEDIRNKKQIQTLLMIEKIQKYNWDIKRYVELEQETLERMSIFSAHDWKNAYAQLQTLLKENYSGTTLSQKETENKKKIRELEMEIISRKIPGFFPTPKPIIERMIEMAEIRPGNAVLDPSAGKGDILDAVEEKFGLKVSIGAFEINSTLREILELKGYPVHGSNFLDFNGEKFDKILMNPPFENGKDIEHVMHAYSVLKPGGRIVAVMSEGVFFRSHNRDTLFRHWLHNHNGLISEPIKDAFKNAFKSTGVNVRIVMIDKPGKSKTELEETDDMELLELEAQAELELLQMEAEARQKNKQGLKGYEKKEKTYPEVPEQLVSDLGAAEKAIPEIKLSYKRDTGHFSEKITRPEQSAEFIRKLYEEGTIDLQEYFIVLFLNRSNRIMGYNILSKGGISGTIADVRLIFSTALKGLATSIILAHNHPSGELKPSEPDIALTRRIREGGKLMDIQVLDHLIITQEGYYSFADEGLL